MEPTEKAEPRPLGPSPGVRRPLAPVPVPTQVQPSWVEIASIEVPELFRLRSTRGVAVLAEAIARDGQREPLLLRRGATGALELISGARRLEALRLLQRDQVLARVHEDLDEGEALYLALCEALDRDRMDAPEIEVLRKRLAAEGRLENRLDALFERVEKMQQARMLEEPPAGGSSGESEFEELELEDLAARARDGLADACNDLSVLHEAWADLDEGRREDLLECLRYLCAMLPLLEDPSDDGEIPR